MNAILALKKELFTEFSVNFLRKCDACDSSLDRDLTDQIHEKLINTYNELSDLKRLLSPEEEENF